MLNETICLSSSVDADWQQHLQALPENVTETNLEPYKCKADAP